MVSVSGRMPRPIVPPNMPGIRHVIIWASSILVLRFVRNAHRDTSGTLAAVCAAKLLILLARPTGFEPVSPP